MNQKKLIFLIWVLSIVLVLSCAPKTKTITTDQSTVKVTAGETSGWCSVGTKANYQGAQGQLNMKIIDKETLTLGGKSIETCHMVQEGSGQADFTMETWTSEDSKYSKVILKTGAEETATESWIEAGKQCSKMYNPKTREVAFEQCS